MCFLSHLSLYFFAKFFSGLCGSLDFHLSPLGHHLFRSHWDACFDQKYVYSPRNRRISDMLKHASSDFWNSSTHVTNLHTPVIAEQCPHWGHWTGSEEARPLWRVPLWYPVALASSWSKQKVGCTIENPQSEGQEKTWTTSMNVWVVILLAALKQEEVELHLPSVSYMGEWSKCSASDDRHGTKDRRNIKANPFQTISPLWA